LSLKKESVAKCNTFEGTGWVNRGEKAERSVRGEGKKIIYIPQRDSYKFSEQYK